MKTVHHSILVSIGFLLALGYSPMAQAAPGTTIESPSELNPIAQLEPNSTTVPSSPLLSAPIVAPANPMPTDLGNESVSKDTVIPGQQAVPTVPEVKAIPSPAPKEPVPIAPQSVPNATPSAMPPETPAAAPVVVPDPATRPKSSAAPDFLTTPANPLLFPTKPQEVTIEPIFPLTDEKINLIVKIVENEVNEILAVDKSLISSSDKDTRRRKEENTRLRLQEVNNVLQSKIFSFEQFSRVRRSVKEKIDLIRETEELKRKQSQVNPSLELLKKEIENAEEKIRALDKKIYSVVKTEAGSVPLSLEQTIELAERNNRDLAISRLQVQQQQAVVRESQASLYPTLDLQSNLNRSLSASGTIGIKAAQADVITQFGSEAAARLLSPQSFRRSIADESTSWDTSLQLNYDLYTSGASAARRRIAAGNLRAAELAMERVREQLRLDVTGEYYDLQEANEQVNINEQSVKNSEQSLRDANAQERAGLGTKFDVLRSEVQLANNQQQLTNSLANEEIGRRKIAQRLSLPEFVTVSAADAVTPAGTWKLNLEETIVTAYKQRVELEEQLVQRDISEAARTQALSALGPRIQLQARYNLLKIFEQPVSEVSSGYSVAAVASWRLFDGGAARSQAQQQEVGKQIAETRFTQSRNAIRFQVEQSYATLTSSGKNIETTTKALGQACEARRLAKLRFDAGVGTQTDVLNAETDLTRSAGSRVTAILNYNRSIAQLLRAVSNVAKDSTLSPTSPSLRVVGDQKPDFCSKAYIEIR